jgi:DNA-binding transcriptional LysR family regulator
VVPILLASLLNPLNRKYSAVEFEVIAQGTVEIQLCLLEGQTEITLTYDLDLHPKIERKTLWCLEPYVLLSNQHPLSELEGEPMVLFDGPNSHDHFNAILSPQNFRSTVQHRRDTFE